MTRLADRVPVEALSSERVQRIEDRVASAFVRARTEAPLATRRRAWLWAPAVAVAAAAVVFALVRGDSAPGRAPAPTRIATAPDEGARLAIGDATIELAGASAAEIVQGPDGAISVALLRGRVECDVAPRPHRPPFTVTAGEVAVHVVGTRFAVERDDEVRVSVTRGQVRVVAAGAQVAVAAGERWSRVLAADARLPSWAAVAAEPPRLASVDPARGAGEPPAAPGDPVEARDAPPQPAPVASAGAVEVPRRRRNSAPEPARDDEGTRDDDGARADALPSPHAGTPPGQRFERLRALEQTDLDAAIAAYQQSLRGADAEYALYRLAYVEYAARGRTRAALRFAEAVEKRFPTGTYAAHAHWLRIHALHAAGDKSACRAAAQSYLRRYTDGDHREHARRLMDWY